MNKAQREKVAALASRYGVEADQVHTLVFPSGWVSVAIKVKGLVFTVCPEGVSH
jgi:hypothetical protein